MLMVLIHRVLQPICAVTLVTLPQKAKLRPQVEIKI